MKSSHDGEAGTNEAIVFANGEFVPASEARISVFDHAVLYGDGVFDTTFCWNGLVFKLEEHLDRLFRSLAYVKIEPPHPRDELRELILETVRRNELENAYVKCVITRGTTERPLLDPRGAKPGCIIFALPYLSLVTDDAQKAGVRLKASTLRRTPPSSLDPRVKNLNYLNIVLGLIEAQAAGADTAVMLDLDGHVSEGAGFNVFAVRDSRLTTPPGTVVLEGITRATVLELATELGIEASEEPVALYDLYTADEVFLSSTAGGLMPVTEVDGRRVGEGKPGPFFERINDAYLATIESGRHGTPVYPGSDRAKSQPATRSGHS
jgi:branched-chain amino acid aminotransferase